QDIVDRALARTRSGQRFHAIAGEAQTDFIISGFDKGRGLTALGGSLGTEAWLNPAIAMAVGDTASDLPMFELADRCFAPSNADRWVRQSAASRMTRLTILNRPYQSGLAKAVAALVGHLPGNCSACRRPVVSESTDELIGL